MGLPLANYPKDHPKDHTPSHDTNVSSNASNGAVANPTTSSEASNPATRDSENIAVSTNASGTAAEGFRRYGSQDVTMGDGHLRGPSTSSSDTTGNVAPRLRLPFSSLLGFGFDLGTARGVDDREWMAGGRRVTSRRR
ncbi:hypothetical protein P7C73_g427, partial [Tremellales sp. Uapishka_1]